MNRTNYFIRPPLVTLEDFNYKKGTKTYTEYNYLKPGIVSYFKTRHFETSLRLTKEYFYKYNVIDFGCADGPFLPSLSKYFNHVVGIDKKPIYIKIASKLCDKLCLNNVQLICNNSLNINDMKSLISTKKYHILFLLEILEHVGDKDSIYESKIDFLKELFTLIDEKGFIVIAVPRMVGIPFLIQRVGLSLLDLHRQQISITNLVKASLFNDTTELEKEWDGDHLGFNNKKLERYLRNEFHILMKKDLFFRVIYVIRKHT